MHNVSYVTIFSRVEHPRALFNSLAVPLGTANLVDMSGAFKNNFISMFGEDLKHRTVDANIDIGSYCGRITDVISLPVIVPENEIQLLYNFMSVVRIELNDPQTRLELVEHDITRLIAARPGTWIKTERDKESISTLFPFEEITTALNAAVVFQNRQRFAADVRTYSEIDDNRLCSMAIQAFYELGGSLLVHIEAHQSEPELRSFEGKQFSEITNRIYRLRLYLANFNRIFMTSSQSYSRSRRQFCELASETFRLRQRLEWHNKINTDYENLAQAGQRQEQLKNARLVSAILFALTVFTVFSGTFFGILSVNPSGELVKSGLIELADSRYLGAFVVALAALLITLIASWIWSRTMADH